MWHVAHGPQYSGSRTAELPSIHSPIDVEWLHESRCWSIQAAWDFRRTILPYPEDCNAESSRFGAETSDGDIPQFASTRTERAPPKQPQPHDLMKVFSVLAIATLAVVTSPVDGHGGMIEPAPRALTTMGIAIANTFGWPIKMRATATKGKVGNCLDFTQDKTLKPLSTGKSKIKMRANDGANHIGPCTAYLVDPRDKTNKVQVGQMKDCMRSLHPGPGIKGDQPIPAEMTITVPTTGLPCDNGHCVLEWYWEATHLAPHELYNNCADVKISGAGGSSSAPAPAPAPALKPSSAPAPVPNPTTGPAPVLAPAQPTSSPASGSDPGQGRPPSTPSTAKPASCSRKM